MDPLDIAIPKGGGKRRKLSSSSPKIVESNRSTVAPIETVVDVPGIADGFSALAYRGYVNEKGTTDEMDWSIMEQEEAQNQQNDADVLEICPVDILSCYWKPNNGMLVLRITGLNGPGEDLIKAEDVKVGYTYALSLYLIGTSIGMKKAWENCNFWSAKERRD